MGVAKPRVLPNNSAAEKSILGGVFLRNEVLTLLPLLEPDDFYDLRHKVVFTAFRNLEAQSRPIDVVTIETELLRLGKLEAVGGVAFLGELALSVPTPDNVVAYAEIVRDHHVSRKTMLAIAEIMELGYSEEVGGDKLVAMLASTALHIGQSREAPIVTMAEVINAEAKRIEIDLERKARGEFAFSGVPTGFHDIDENVGGWPLGLLSLVLSRPAVGKTTVAMNTCNTATNKFDEPSILVSYEDGGPSMGQRGIAQHANVDTQVIRARKINEVAFRALAEGVGKGQLRRELFLHAVGLNVEQLVARVRSENLRRKNSGLKKIRGVHIDHIGLIPEPSHKIFPTRDQRLGHISRTLAVWAQQDDIAVVAYCQLNRDLEKRDDHRPRLSDIRDSGNLEQDGKFIVGLHRPWLYDQALPKEDLRMFVLKNHNGEAAIEVPLWVDLPTNRIFDNGLDFSHWRGRRI